MDTKKTGTRGDQSPAQALTAPYLPAHNSPRTFAAQTRGKGKRERTRARLIDATAELIAKGGADSATIAEITATAGLASGTFYNHFKDRAEIIAETAISIMEQIASQINLAGRAEKDILVRFAAGTRRFLDIAYGHPTWAWAVLRSLDYLPDLRPRVYGYVGSTVHIGYEGGQFSHEDDFTLHILNAMLFAAVRARLTGKSGPDTGCRIAEMQLRVLGVPAGRARAAANRSVAEVDFAWSDSPVSNKGNRKNRKPPTGGEEPSNPAGPR